jgi:hypothetical protein
MEKVKFFHAKSASSIATLKHPDYDILEKEVNNFLANEGIKIIDIQYRLEISSGTPVLAGVMVRYEET